MVGQPISASLTHPRQQSLSLGRWSARRFETYSNEQPSIPIKRSRIDELLVAEGLR